MEIKSTDKSNKDKRCPLNKQTLKFKHLQFLSKPLIEPVLMGTLSPKQTLKGKIWTNLEDTDGQSLLLLLRELCLLKEIPFVIQGFFLLPKRANPKDRCFLSLGPLKLRTGNWFLRGNNLQPPRSEAIPGNPQMS